MSQSQHLIGTMSRSQRTKAMADANAIKLEKRYAKRKKPVVRKPAKWCPPPAKRPNIFMTLPPELRNVIYEDVLSHRQTMGFVYHSGGSWPDPAMLHVSKAIRAEAISIYYPNNRFDFRIRLCALPGLCRKLQRLTEQCGSQPLGSIRLEIMQPGWDRMHYARHLALLFYNGTELYNYGARDARPGLYPLLVCSYSMCRAALEHAVEIGEQGAEEGWSKEKMEARLDKLLKLASAARTEGSSSKAWKLAMGV
ncbi:hypothetical protein LTR56_023853 [Elasticomyces elasticus]|nr:hypothetical protein LTR56_023853 [Elasticomyces elasticus]KAK3666851.1 hypothetical protein LTR22_002438 [Elasticomyces elasticus]KAK4907774.1 hypothetical protein LTR49_023238 [Elasticomyces elasticus]KAK5746985.1 hypothetical protein LTS12_022554 [Elasticomyces elasticus]